MPQPTPTCAAHQHHWVLFYREESSLRANVAAYVASALRAGRPALVIGRPELVTEVRMEVHREHVQGHPFGPGRGELVVADAAQTLDRFCIGGQPHRGRFNNVIGGMVAALAVSGRPLAAYGEMVALLCGEGRYEAAMKLEALWNELLARHSVALYCAYQTRLFGSLQGRAFEERARAAHAAAFEEQRGGVGLPQWKQVGSPEEICA